LCPTITVFWFLFPAPIPPLLLSTTFLFFQFSSVTIFFFLLATAICVSLVVAILLSVFLCVLETILSTSLRFHYLGAAVIVLLRDLKAAVIILVREVLVVIARIRHVGFEGEWSEKKERRETRRKAVRTKT